MSIDPGMTQLQRIELGDQVTGALRNLIFAGELHPGERLVESELAERFGTSRGPVRDAFAELEQAGLVRSENRRGTYVAQLTPVDVDELYTLRLSLEALAVRRAADRIGPRQLAGLSTVLADLADALEVGDAVAVGRSDMAFHRTIVQIADHARLLAAWERLGDQTRLLMQELSEYSPEIQSSVGDHGEIFAAFASGDASAAARALENHLMAARAVMVRRFGEVGAAD